MNTPESFNWDKYRPLPREKAPNPINSEAFETFESIADVRKYLDEQGLAIPGVAFESDDYEAVLIRAKKILDQNPGMDEETALSNAYVDRLSAQGEAGVAILKRIDPEILADVFSNRLKRTVSLEDVQMVLRRIESGFRAHSENVVTEWASDRARVEGFGQDTVAVIGKDDLVRLVAEGGPVELLKRAVTEEQGLPPEK